MAVVGLRARCGATTVACALATELALRDPGGVAAVTSAGERRGPRSLGLPSAGRLARSLAPASGGLASACGRLCLVPGADRLRLADATRYLAPLVIDTGDPAEAHAAAALAGATVVVGSPDTEPSLAAAVAEGLERVGPRPVIVLSRAAPDPGRWLEVADIALPDARMGAALALAGREPRGELGAAVRRLTHVCLSYTERIR